MKLIRMGLFAAAATCLLTTTAVAQNPAGSWKGKIDMKVPDMPQMQDPKAKQMIAQTMEMMKKMVINLTMKADKTYTIDVTGAPQGAGGDNSKDNGTWSQSGKSITFKSKKKQGMGNGDKPQVMTLSADGKTLSMKIPGGPGGPGGGGSITFKKA